MKSIIKYIIISYPLSPIFQDKYKYKYKICAGKNKRLFKCKFPPYTLCHPYHVFRQIKSYNFILFCSPDRIIRNRVKDFPLIHHQFFQVCTISEIP